MIDGRKRRHLARIIFLLNVFLYFKASSQSFEIGGGLNSSTISNYSFKFGGNLIYRRYIYSIGYYFTSSVEMKLRSNLFFDSGLDFSERKFKDNLEYFRPNYDAGKYISFIHRKNGLNYFVYFDRISVEVKI